MTRLLPWTVVAVAVALAAAGCDSRPDAGSEPAASFDDASSGVKVAAAGDFGMKESGVRTLSEMATADPDLYLALGDFTYEGPDSADEFCELVADRLGAGAPFAITPGNHEEDPGVDGRAEEFEECLPRPTGPVGQYARQYYLDIGRLARIVMISASLTINGERYGYDRAGGGPDRHLRWLERTIAGARARGTRWIIVGMHHNCLSTGRYACEISHALLSTLLRRGVDLVLAGHDHTYQRSKQISAPRPGCRRVMPGEFDLDCVVDGETPYVRGRGTAFVIAGTGGAFDSLYPLGATDAEAPYFAAAMGQNTEGRRHGFVLLSIEPRRLVGRFVPSTPGTFTDHFTIRDRGH